MNKKIITIVSPTYNEEENVLLFYSRVNKIIKNISNYQFEFLFIDNASTDETANILKDLAKQDKKIKVILNTRNFGHIRSPYWGIIQSQGDATILIASDLQDPPEMIPEFIKKWELGFKTVLAVKPESDESSIMFKIRKAYYLLISRISEAPLVQNATGAGLFDRIVIDILKDIQDPYPYFRGLLCEIGFPIATVPFKQPQRAKGVTKNNFYTLYDLAMLGITNHSKIPLRLMALSGFALSFLSLITALIFLTAKLLYWDSFQLGTAPIIIGVFFFGAMQAFFIGILGEYIGSIHTKVRKMPLVIELERVNF